MPRLSVIVITKNEARNIGACLGSVRFADEIVVVDSGSDDGTPEIARAAGARVVETDWPGFGPQKNRALDLATGEWVLSIDADERVTPELREEILRAIADGRCSAYRMPRLSSYCGRYLRHGGWWPDRVLRLFRRGRARFTDARVHERVVAEGPVGDLRAPLLHETFRTPDDVLDTIQRYSSAGAQQLLEQGKRGGLIAAIGHGLWMFFRTYVLKAGFLDGREGFMLAVSNAEGSYYKRLKLFYLSRAQGEERER